MEDRLHPEDERERPITRTLTTEDGLHGFGAASPDLACITDDDGVITSVNPAWSSILGWTRRDPVGRRFVELVHDEDVERTLTVLDRVVAGETIVDLTIRCLAADDDWRWISWSATLGRDGRLVYLAGRDVTGQEEQRTVAARTAAELSAALTAERAACDELRERDRRKDTYLSAVSHELRGPLAVAHRAAETLTQLRGDIGADEARELEDLIVDQTQRVARTLDQLLDVDRLGHGELTVTRRRVELVGLVGDVIAASRAADRISLVAPDTVRLHADEAQVEHLVANLLDNAAKYAPDGAIVTTIDVDDTCVRIGVRDQGPGIPDHALETVFEPHWRADSHQDRPGTGLGLALVAEFARLHGGRAWAEPTTRGAHVVVELPVDADG